MGFPTARAWAVNTAAELSSYPVKGAGPGALFSGIKSGQLAIVLTTGISYVLQDANGATGALPTRDDLSREWTPLSSGTSFPGYWDDDPLAIDVLGNAGISPLVARGDHVHPGAVMTPAEFQVYFPTCLPIGDSTTAGTGDNIPDPTVTPYWPGVGNDGTGGYRWHLLNFLRAQGFVPLEISSGWFKGTVTATSKNLPSSDRQHQGVSGQTLDQMNTAFPSVWAATPAGVIIVSGGINDIGLDGQTPAQTAVRMETLLTTIFVQTPDTPVLVWSPPAGTTYYAQIQAYAALLPAVVAARVSAGQRVWFCDVSNKVTKNTEVNALHPNAYGYRDIAALIFRSLMTYPFINT